MQFYPKCSTFHHIMASNLSNYSIFKFDLGDKLVDQAEYVQVLGFFGVSEENALKCFDKFGTSVNFIC